MILALESGATLVNTSFGSPSLDAARALEDPVRRLLDAGLVVVAPATAHGLPCYPGLLPGVQAVIADPVLERRDPPLHQPRDGHDFWRASPHPRDLPHLPRQANLTGDSLAAANLAAWLTRPSTA